VIGDGYRVPPTLYRLLSNEELLVEVQRAYKRGETPTWETVNELTGRLASVGRTCGSALRRAHTAHTLIGTYNDALKALAIERREAIIELVQSGTMDQTQIAAELGLTRSRVSQIIAK
jgi:hypothetical protein